MIVADTNIIVYFYLSVDHGPETQLLLKKDREWVAPLVWKSEFRNALVLYLRKGLLPLDEAFSIQVRAELLMATGERAVDSEDVLRLANSSQCSAYDCEFIALAEHLGVRLVTEDQRLLKAFPNVAISLADALV